MNGVMVDGQTEVATVKLNVPDGAKVIPLREFRPGQVFIGDKHILNFFMILDDMAELNHPTYLERS